MNTPSPPIPPIISAQSRTWSATPFTSVITVTGQAKTLTITPTAPPASTMPSGSSGGRDGLFSHTGKVVGLFVSLALIILLAAVLGIGFFIRRKRNSQAVTFTSNPGDDTPQRRPSRLSQMGLVSGRQRLGAGRGIPSIQTSGWGPGTGGEKSPSDTTTPLDLRSSYPRVVDQRLDPVALWNPLHDNGSHISVRSFQDDQDYSRRMLRVSDCAFLSLLCSTPNDGLFRLQIPTSKALAPSKGLFSSTQHRLPPFFTPSALFDLQNRPMTFQLLQHPVIMVE